MDTMSELRELADGRSGRRAARGAAVAQRLHRGAGGRAHDRGPGPDREPRAARRGRPRVRRPAGCRFRCGCRRRRGPGRGPLDEFLQQIALVADADPRRDDEGLVTLMTLHNAKGLEYPTVFIAGCEDGVFPHSRAIDEGSLEEERRLFYVGVTRAMRTLYLTYARRRALFGAQSYGLRSRFLDEIPARPAASPGRAAVARGPAGRLLAIASRQRLGGQAPERRAAQLGCRRRRHHRRRAPSSASARTSSTPPSATGS